MHKSILSDVVQTQLSLTGGNKATAGYPSARPLLELGILIPPVMVTIKIYCSWCLIPKQPPDRELQTCSARACIFVYGGVAD